MIERLKLETISKDNEEELLDFYRRELKAWKRFEDLWFWRNHEPKVSGGEQALVARYGGTIVGAIGIVPQRLVVEGETIRAAWQQDSLVSRKMRGQGVGKRLVETGTKGFELVLAKGTSAAMHELRKAVGFKDVAHSDLMVRVLRPRAFETVETKTWIMEGVLAAWAKAMQTVGQGRKAEESVREIKRFDAAFDSLADKLANENILRPSKGQQWLGWRYAATPARRYRIFRNTAGAIVLNDTVGNGEGWIVDLMVDGKIPNGDGLLIRRALVHFQTLGIERVYVFATFSKRRRQLMRYGFLPTGRSPRFTYWRTAEAEFPEGILGGGWDFWHGDGDVELYM